MIDDTSQSVVRSAERSKASVFQTPSEVVYSTGLSKESYRLQSYKLAMEVGGLR